MSSESPRLCDASPLTDGELHLLSERHPELDGFSSAVLIGSGDRKVIDVVEAFLAAFSDSVDSRFGLAALSAGERSIFSERRPEFGVHEVDLVAATSDAKVARLLEASVALFGVLEEGKPEAKLAKEVPKREAPKKEPVAEVKEPKEAKADEPVATTPVIAAMAPSAVPGTEPAADRAAWANRLNS